MRAFEGDEDLQNQLVINYREVAWQRSSVRFRWGHSTANFNRRSSTILLPKSETEHVALTKAVFVIVPEMDTLTSAGLRQTSQPHAGAVD